VLALYERPYCAKEPVVCLDEKPVPLHTDVRPPRPAHPGHVAQRDNEYRRGETANIFGVVEPKAGRHFTCVMPKRSSAAFARMIRTVITAYPAARTIHPGAKSAPAAEKGGEAQVALSTSALQQ